MSTTSTDVLRDQETRPRHTWWDWMRLILLGAILAVTTGIVMVRPLLPTSLLPAGRVALNEGEVAPSDIRAPRDITFESGIRYAEEQTRAASAVVPVYTLPDPGLARQQLDRARQVLDYLGSVRADPLASPAQKHGWILAVEELSILSSDMISQLLALSDASWDRVKFETLAVVDQAMRGEIREGFLEQALESIPARVSLDLSSDEAMVTVALAQQFLIPNSFLDPEATTAARTLAREQVQPPLRTFGADEIIVREGERVDPLDIEALDQFGLRQPQIRWSDWISAMLLAVLGTSLLGLYLARFQPQILWQGQQWGLVVLLTSVTVLIAGLMVPGGEVLRYLNPAPMLALLASAALGPHAGVATAVFAGGAIGVIADYSLEMAAYATLGGLVAALTVGRVERISALFRSGAFVSIAQVLMILIFRLSLNMTQFQELLAPMLSGVAGGGISASLALGGLFIIGPLFDLTTTMRLIELSRPDHPLLQRLLREAPATYHHSLVVANLAEQAAESIGADALLTRVGAYYHDVGKIARPYFFMENQVDGINPHDRLDPQTSAEVIIGHVSDGIELARRYRLPRRVRAFISEHHGTNWVSFFYNKAVQLATDPDSVDPDNFHHRGPNPQSRETALVMLSDSCEAAVRSARPSSAEDVAEIVNRIISQRIEDGQLNESGLSLRDIDLVREAFISSLKGVFHPRIQYPSEEKETQT